MFEPNLFITLFCIGLFGAFFSALLGLGGAIVIVPLLLYIPPMIGVGVLDMKMVAGITILVVFAASLTGVLVHNKNHMVSKSLVIFMGITAICSSFLGAVYSKYTTDNTLLALFAFMAVLAAVIMLLPKKEDDEKMSSEDIKYSRTWAFLIAFTVGFIGGMVGAPGAFIFVPLLIYVLKVPTKIAIGTTLGIVFVSSISGAVGKIVTGQVPYLLTSAVLIGSVTGAQAGARYTKKIKAATLRKALAGVIAIAATRMILDVLK